MEKETRNKGELRALVRGLYTEIKREERRKTFKNCTVLMEQYREMKRYVQNAVSEIDEMEAPPIYEAGASLTSLRRCKCETAMLLYNVDRAVEELREEAKHGGISYKFDAFFLHYIEGKTYEEICEVLSCGKNSPAHWCAEMIRLIAVKLFGANGIDFR